MSQRIKIECSDCEAVDEYEMENCVLIGWKKEGGLFIRQHEVTLGQLLHEWLDKEIKEKLERG